MSTSARPGGLLTERLRPGRLTEIVGNPWALEKLRTWAQGWGAGRGPPRRRAVILEGRPGVGKTTAAWALARELGWTLVEMNASEARNRTAIEQVAGRASYSNAFSATGEYRSARDGARTLILLDEADCLSGRATEAAASRPAPMSLREFLRGRYGQVDALARAWGLGIEGAPPAFKTWEEVPGTAGRGAWTRLKPAMRDVADWKSTGTRTDSSDRGGLGAIAALVRTTRQPLVLTVNDSDILYRYSPVFRQGAEHITFDPVPGAEIRKLLRAIVLREGYSVQSAAIDRIVERSQGDVRAALTDLDAVTPIPAGPAQLAILGGRDRSSEFEEFIQEVFSHPRYYRSVEIRDRLDATPDDLFPWIEENLPHAAPPGPRQYSGFEALGRAELFLARARRYRHYGLWSYASEIMTGGVSSALDRSSGAPLPEARFPMFLAAMGRARVQRQVRQSLLRKVGGALHLSSAKALESTLPMLFELFDPALRTPAARAIRAGLVRRAKLSEEEVAYLMGVEPDSPHVVEALAQAEPSIGREVDWGNDPEPEQPETPSNVPPEVSGASARAPNAEPVKGTPRSKSKQRALGEF
jgi:DNA polymerase III delta prime subunit